MKYTAILFDLDGTILDTIQELAISMNEVRSMAGLTPQPIEKVRAMVGNGIRNLIKRSLASDIEAGAEVSPDEIFANFMNYYNEHCIENTRPYDGITELLMELKNRGVKLAVVSNKADYPSCKLINHFFPGIFDYVRGNKEGTPLKPDPAVIKETLDILGEEVSSALYVGDSEVDLQTARNSGMDSIVVDWGFKSHEFLVEHGAQVIVSDMKSLLDAILNSN